MKLCKERLLQVLPEINELKNEDWKEACVAIWQEAFEKSAWNEILEAPNNESVPSDTLIRHTRGVIRAGRNLAKALQEEHGLSFDDDKFLLISLIHDVCKLMELEKVDGQVQKSFSGFQYVHGELSGRLAEKYNLPVDVCASVRNHSQFVKELPPTLEGVIMCYADLADADMANYLHGKNLLLNYTKIIT